MILKCIIQRSFHTLNNNTKNHLFLSSKPFSLSSVFSQTPKKKNQESKKPLSVCFKESVGISEKTNGFVQPEEENPLIKKLRELSEQVKTLKNDKTQEKGKKLNLFTEKTETIRDFGPNNVKKEISLKKKGDFGVKKETNLKKKGDVGVKKETGLKVKKDLSLEKKCDLGSIVVKNESKVIYKELSPDMGVFVRFLEEEGYFKDANFLRDGKLDLSSFREFYERAYLVSAAVKFGKEHQEIAKWLSASDLKKVANFGCPSIGSKAILAAKHLREFFKTEEVKVCQSCVLKESCKFANKKTGHTRNLQLKDVMMVIIMYAMESVPQQLVVPVPEEIQSSVSILLKEVMALSKTVHDS